MEEMTFIRKDFYLDPPTKDASAEEWQEWVKKDERKASAHKASHTRAVNLIAEEEGTLELPESNTTMKVGGVWRQATAIGFSGSAEEGTCRIEPIVEAQQEQFAILRRMEMTRNIRGGSKAGKSARRRANRKK